MYQYGKRVVQNVVPLRVYPWPRNTDIIGAVHKCNKKTSKKPGMTESLQQETKRDK